MGEVCRARDPSLGRDVAIKMSAERFSYRFERWAFFNSNGPFGDSPLQANLAVSRQGQDNSGQSNYTKN